MMSYFVDTSRFVEESSLSKRVREWEDKIKPTLLAEEAHEPFDIHVYGHRLISRFPEEGICGAFFFCLSFTPRM